MQLVILRDKENILTKIDIYHICQTCNIAEHPKQRLRFFVQACLLVRCVVKLRLVLAIFNTIELKGIRSIQKTGI